jgi:hypothetical protein
MSAKIFFIFLLFISVGFFFVFSIMSNQTTILREKTSTDGDLSNNIDEFSFSSEDVSSTTQTYDSYDDFPQISSLHWGKMPITYTILNEDICGHTVVSQIVDAFQRIQTETNNTIMFEKLDSEGKISLECFKRYDSNIALQASSTYADARVTHVYADAKENVIYAAKINLYKVTEGTVYGRCGLDYPETIIHEILHLFGFEDTNHGSSIMYMYIGACHGEIDQEIKEELIKTYSLN